MSNSRSGKAYGKVVMNYGTAMSKKNGEKGLCASCKKREGKHAPVPGGAGIPLLCDRCVELRRQRIAANKDRYYSKAAM